MARRTFLLVAAVAVLLIASSGIALGTPVQMATAETARGPLVDRPLDINMHFAPGTWAKLSTKGPIEVAYQRITIAPGGTLGWHSHPGPTVVTVLIGELSFYHAEACTERIGYAAGQSFSNLPHEIHLARNEGSVDVVVYASYYLPLTSPVTPLRTDQPSPGADCPQ
jgi:quercetin dioxygenase-like cupin family protein